jgi:hypothetical protein
MALDVTSFHKLVVTDTCSVWNVLSSRLLHRTSVGAGCCFSMTDFTLYECLEKRREEIAEADLELQRRLRAARAEGQFKTYPLDVADLQDLDVLEQRKRLGKGELAAIVFAKKTRQAFLTDDQSARALATTTLTPQLVQTTPQMLGWLVFVGRLGDSDLSGIIEEHEKHRRPLKPYFAAMCEEGLRRRLMAWTSPT